ncbi:MAG: filamentous hemagglutinin N-terminal domain-containing protein [Thermodesulfobacteriota bacterium]
MPARADITTDGTVGPAVSLAGPDFQIPHDLGTLSGENLFHSFQAFSIHEGESATFAGPGFIRNVISRVTGGEPSTIDGLLRSQVGRADFFFINPAGVFFGPDGQVDVPGAFHVSTADELRFADGSTFSASDPGGSTLTVASPESFGFLSPQPGSILLNGSRLAFAPESRVSLQGGEIAVTGTEAREASIRTEGGTICLSAVGDEPAAVPITGRDTAGTTGTLRIESARVDASGQGGGHIRINAGTAKMREALVAADNTGAGNSDGGVDVRVLGDLTVSEGSRIQSGVHGQGNSGGVRIRSENLSIHQGESESMTGLFSEVEPGAGGDSGGIRVDAAKDVSITGAGAINAGTYGHGDAGSVAVEAENIRIEGQGRSVVYRDMDGFIAGIAAEAGAGSTGNAGAVSVSAAERFSIQNSGAVSAAVSGAGNGAPVEISAKEVVLDGGNSGVLTAILNGSGNVESGSGGDIVIEADEAVRIENGGMVSSFTGSREKAGDIRIRSGRLTVVGAGSGIGNFTGGEGDAGEISMEVDGPVNILEGASIAATSSGPGNGGAVTLRAKELTMDSRDAAAGFTGITASTGSGLTGNAGAVDILVAGLFEIRGWAGILDGTFGEGRAGDVTVQAGDFRIVGAEGGFAGIRSGAFSGSQGNAGKVDVSVKGFMEMQGSAEISSNAHTDSSGDAGSVHVAAGESLELLNGAELSSSTFGEGSGGSVVIRTKSLKMESGALLASSTFGEGSGGSVVIRTKSLILDGGDAVGQTTGITGSAYTGSQGDAGTLDVEVDGRMEIRRGAEISSSTFGQGNAGNITIRAGEARLDAAGAEGRFTGIANSTLPGSEGDAGSVDIKVEGLLEMQREVQIQSSTFSIGNAGKIRIDAGNIRMNSAEAQVTIIGSTAEDGSEGHAGKVEIRVEDSLEMLQGARIGSSTYGKGDAGEIRIHSGAMTLNSEGDEGFFTTVASTAEAGSEGNAGAVDITVDRLLDISGGVSVSTGTFAEGNAGELTIRAGDLAVDGNRTDGQFTGIASIANAGSTGDAGNIDIDVENHLAVRSGAEISSNTYASGNGGVIQIEAGSVRIEGIPGQFTGIASGTGILADGNGGKIDIHVDELLEVFSGGHIASSTLSRGNAGEISIMADAVILDGLNSEEITGITSLAQEDAAGYVGSLSVSADEITLQNGGQISIAAYQMVSEDRLNELPEARIRILADRLHLNHHAKITAESTANVPAGAVEVGGKEFLLQNNSRITTASRDADGGPILLHGDTLILKDSLITTSVEGQAGDGGDITLSGALGNPAKVLVLEGGFVQANTAAEKARGGDIFLDVQAVIAESAQVEIGGFQRQDFQPGTGRNIIQAAAPGGEQGTIDITAPNLDISGSLVNLSTLFADSVQLATDPCRFAGGRRASSLVRAGRGGVPAGPEGPSAVSFDGPRLDRLLHSNGSDLNAQRKKPGLP